MKIAILGSSPSQNSAPFDDPTWEIWTCSPDTVGVPRVDFHFEIHSLESIERLGEDHVEYLRALPVYMQEAFPQFPHSIKYPKDEMLAEFGPHFFTSSIAYMLALAISRKPERIGLWGVDMLAEDEYDHQRPGCFRFIEIARERGIDVFIPEGSGLLIPTKLYGYE